MDPLKTERFKILNREASIVAELLTNGLENSRKISSSHAYYYQSFYALSMGLERLMKLILNVEQSGVNLKTHGHKLKDLINVLGINFNDDSIEAKLISFLNDFAEGDRYSIVDFLSRGDKRRLANEPVVKFYSTIIKDILETHPPHRVWLAPNIDELGHVLHNREDLSAINSLSDLAVHTQLVEHASKYYVMYAARIMRPLIGRLSNHDGYPKNPYFSEHFRFLPDDDSRALNRKTFRS